MEIFCTTDTLILRRLCTADLEPFLAYRNDPVVAKYQSWKPMDATAATGFLTAMETEPILTPGQWSQIAIARPADNLLMGDMGWCLSENAKEAELGITLAQEHQGKGIATEAMRLAAAYVLAHSPARRLVAYADIRNKPSCVLMPRAGFTQIGTEEYQGVMEHIFELRRSG